MPVAMRAATAVAAMLALPPTLAAGPPSIRAAIRKLWRVRCVDEQVACTTNVTRCVTEKVPSTVCKKVCTNEIKQVPYTVRRNIRGAYVDDHGGAFDCDGPGRAFKEGAVARKV